jgi:hypothetical protein
MALRGARLLEGSILDVLYYSNECPAHRHAARAARAVNFSTAGSPSLRNEGDPSDVQARRCLSKARRKILRGFSRR